MPGELDRMSDEEFIDYCYDKVLRRPADLPAKKHYSGMLDSGVMSRLDLFQALLTCQEYRDLFESPEFVPAGHFYSAIPSAEDRRHFISTEIESAPLVGVEMNEKEQLELLKLFETYYHESPFPEEKSDTFRYYFRNPAYSYADGLTLYCMMRHFKPKRIIEIGSGFSSALMMDTAERFFGSKLNITFLEPYPELLYSLMRDGDKERYRVIPERSQRVDLSLFSQLEENDMLFIDSTHVSKLSSDVNKQILDILPVLKKGVLIHVHDIFWPFEYPKAWIEQGRAWNEAYLLRAFLEFNSAFRILFFADFLLEKHKELVRLRMPLFLKHAAGNIWLGRSR